MNCIVCIIFTGPQLNHRFTWKNFPVQLVYVEGDYPKGKPNTNVLYIQTYSTTVSRVFVLVPYTHLQHEIVINEIILY